MPHQDLIKFAVGTETVRGWLHLAPGTDNPSLLILRGGGNIPTLQSDNPKFQAQLASHGINSLSVDYRGVGESDGRFTDTGIATRTGDATAAVSALRAHSPGGQLYLFGASMGAPVAITLPKMLAPRDYFWSLRRPIRSKRGRDPLDPSLRLSSIVIGIGLTRPISRGSEPTRAELLSPTGSWTRWYRWQYWRNMPPLHEPSISQ